MQPPVSGTTSSGGTWSRRQFLATAASSLAVAASPGCSTARSIFHARRIEPDPGESGRRVADYVVAHQLDNVEYPTVCCAYGVLLFASATKNSALRQKVESAYAGYLTGGKDPEPMRNGRKIGHRWFGIIPLEIGLQGNDRYREISRRESDLKEAEPVMDGPIYYVDHMYGVGTLQAKAFQHLGDAKYATRCATHLLLHCQKLQRPDSLFHHSERGLPAWGRGNGWAAASLTEALQALPKNHPHRDELFAAWQSMVTILPRHQDAGGLWRQIVDLPSSWLETSSTSMFVYALATGVRKGWVRGKDYRESIVRGWRALANAVDDQGLLADVCIGLGDDPGTVAHYLSCPRKNGDKHGQAPFLWAASAVAQLA